MSDLARLRARFSVQRQPAPEAPCERADLWVELARDTGSTTVHLVDMELKAMPGQPLPLVCGNKLAASASQWTGRAGEAGCWRCRRTFDLVDDDA